ncbi:glucocorticoid-induced transcript 1 protein isoform X2 [Misgurnus anguillicaudatus]|uniref:glucocorticoid-induced transcript 1 protein isoform X2 n=1 Tax=Misgurnus anguillicaudatus TaxID=75329 RepID=UPI003CCF7C95
MKQIVKSTRTPTESHLMTGGRARSAGRQTSLLDDLPEKYLSGQWPHEPHQPRPSSTSDKATQTPGFWSYDGGEVNMHKRSASWGNADHLIEIAKLRQQLQLSLKGSRTMKDKEDVSSTQLNQTQALEVRDGGRAPVPPPHHSDLQTHSMEAQISSPALDIEKDNRTSSPVPRLTCSPKPNHSFTFKREPPEGCEKVKVFEDIVTHGFPIFSCPDRNKVNFSPSGSAFCPVKLLCSSFFPAERAARPSSLENLTGQMSGSEATALNGFHPVPSERCSITKCLLLS